MHTIKINRKLQEFVNGRNSLFPMLGWLFLFTFTFCEWPVHYHRRISIVDLGFQFRIGINFKPLLKREAFHKEKRRVDPC